MVSCCICKSTTNLHRFPIQFIRFMQWTHLIGRPDIIYTKRANYRVCDLHFTEDMKILVPYSNLAPDAFPLLRLPHFSSEQSTSAPCDINISIPGPSGVSSVSQTAMPRRTGDSNRGINIESMRNLKTAVKKMKQRNRYCTLMFNEINLSAGVQFDYKKIIGFSVLGGETTAQLADGALVFMAKGIFKKWKQSISFYFTSGGINAPELKKLIKDNIKALQKVGLKVVSTVCNQTSVNCAAVKSLKDDTAQDQIRTYGENKMFGFTINGAEIIPLFDPPHLLKCLRNNFIGNRIRFQWKNRTQVANWDDIVKLYEMELDVDRDHRMSFKLHEGHVYEEHMNKMKVKSAAQLFSISLSGAIRLIARYGKPELMTPTGHGTADFLVFMDYVFDSVNNSLHSSNLPHKPLKNVVAKKSAHVKFWCEAVRVFNTVKVITPNGREFVPRCVKKWAATLRGFIKIYNKVFFKNRDVKFLCCRNFNKDPLENFFDAIRAQGIRSVNPTCTAFVNSFEPPIVNNLMTTHCDYFNCEKDANEGLLSSSASLLYQNNSSEDMEIITGEHDVLIDEGFSFKALEELRMQVHAYMAGYFVRRLLKRIGACRTCRTFLCSSDSGRGLIETRAYSATALIRPGTQFTVIFNKCFQICAYYLPLFCTKNKIHSLLTSKCHLHVESVAVCPEHNLMALFFKMFVTFHINVWCKKINAVVRDGSELPSTDTLKRLAAEINLSSKRKRRRL